MERLPQAEFPFISGSYPAKSRAFDNQRTLNMYVEASDVGGGKNAAPGYLTACAGLRQVQSLGSGPHRGSYLLSNASRAFFVSGNEVYFLTSPLGSPVRITGNLNTSVGFVSMVDNGTDLLIVDGANGYFVDLSTNVLTTINDPHFYNGAVTCTYLSGYFICDEGPNSTSFFIGTPDSTTWPALNEFSADTSPDVIRALISANQQLYVLGSKTLEVWATNSQATALSDAFTPNSGRSINIGCQAPGTVQRVANTFIFLGQNDQGAGVVYALDSDVPNRVSTHAIEHVLQQAGDLTSATAVAWQEDGHYFYALQVPTLNTTLTYDLTTKTWFDKQTRYSGVFDRWAGQTHCFLNGVHLIGDRSSGNLYQLDQTYDKDGDSTCYRERRTPHISKGVSVCFYTTLQVDIQAGIGSLTEDPRLTLRISRDGGATYGNPVYASMGKVGEYRWRARWNRLGYARDAVFAIGCDGFQPVFLGAFLDYTEGTS
jgi:hypothetical protein